MLPEVLDAAIDRLEVLGPEPIERDAAVRLGRPHRGDEHAGRRREPSEPAHDVAELLEPEVARETCLGDDVVGELERDAVLDDRVVGVGHVPERPRMDHHRLAFERLHEVRFQRVLHDHRHRARHLQLLGRDRLAVRGRRYDDPSQTRPEVGEIGGEREHRHDLGRGRDHEPVLARNAVHLAAQADDRVSELAGVHVEGSGPRDARRVDAVRVAEVQRRVERRRQQVVRGGDRVEVAVEMEVDVLHRDDLRVPAAGAAALDPEHRSHRGFAKAEHDVLADPAHPLRERDRGGRLALARLRRRDGGRDDQLAVRPVREPVQDGQVDLRAVATERFEHVGRDPGRSGDLRDGPELRFLRDLESALHTVVSWSGAARGRSFAGG